MNSNQEAKLDALGDATRRAIIERLFAGPLPVGKLAQEFPVSRPAISQHLRILKQAELVVDESAERGGSTGSTPRDSIHCASTSKNFGPRL